MSKKKWTGSGGEGITPQCSIDNQQLIHFLQPGMQLYIIHYEIQVRGRVPTRSQGPKSSLPC